MIYVYRCPVGHDIEVPFTLGAQPVAVECEAHNETASRCHKCEHKQVSGMAASHALDDWKGDPRDFLPTHDDFRTKADPEGTKGMNEWMEKHTPAENSGGKMIDPRKL